MNVFAGDTEDAKAGRDWLTGLLKDTVVEVVFTKKDGSERTMKATLKHDYIAEHWTPKVEDSQHLHSKDVLPVFDVDAAGWRSFRWDSIKQVNFNLGENNA